VGRWPGDGRKLAPHVKRGKGRKNWSKAFGAGEQVADVSGKKREIWETLFLK